MLGALPADQRLERDDMLAPGVDHRLEVEQQLALVGGEAERRFELAALLGFGMQRRFVDPVLAPARVLGPVKRQVGVAHEHLDRRAVARPHRRTDAGADVELVVLDVVGLRERLDHALGEGRHSIAVGRVADHHGELVSAEPAAHLVVARQLLEPLRDLRQQLVADLVAERIVDRLEAVEVDHQECTARAPLLGVPETVLERFGDHQPIGQSGQRIVPRKVGDFLGRFALLRDVGPHSAETDEIALLVAHRSARDFPPAAPARDLDLDQQVGKALAPLQAFGEVMQARRELPALPRDSSDQLDERFAFDLRNFAAQGISEARTGPADPAIGVHLP